MLSDPAPNQTDAKECLWSVPVQLNDEPIGPTDNIPVRLEDRLMREKSGPHTTIPVKFNGDIEKGDIDVQSTVPVNLNSDSRHYNGR